MNPETITEPQTVTENGAPSLASTGSARVDLFAKWSRDTSNDYLTTLLDASWKESPLDTLKLIFQMRDCRGGKGERHQFHEAMKWLLKKDEATLLECLDHIPFYGRWKDLYVFFGTKVEDCMIEEFMVHLMLDLDSLERGKSVSLCAKYAPSEGSAIDKKHCAVKKLCETLCISKKAYRQHYLTPLRKHLNIVERQLTDNVKDWANIDFEHVPSVAMKKYQAAFKRHQPERYTEYLQKVKAGESKMNVSQLHPHEIVEQYFKVKDWKFPMDETNEVAEAQWTEYVKNIRSKTHVGPAIAMVDVSGSMHGQPVQVAVALGLLLAELNEGIFHNKILTFSAQPQLMEIQGTSLREKIQSINNSSWGMNTNILAAFDAILEAAIAGKTTSNEVPSTIFILSDMQFDAATTERDWPWGQQRTPITTWETVKEKYATAGYTLPKVVYWNLRGNTTDFPVKTGEANVCCVSGFSPSILELIIEGEEVTPYMLMRKAIDRPRYDRLTVAVPTLQEVEVVTEYKGGATTSTAEVKENIVPQPPPASSCLIS